MLDEQIAAVRLGDDFRHVAFGGQFGGTRVGIRAEFGIVTILFGTRIAVSVFDAVEECIDESQGDS